MPPQENSQRAQAGKEQLSVLQLSGQCCRPGMIETTPVLSDADDSPLASVDETKKNITAASVHSEIKHERSSIERDLIVIVLNNVPSRVHSF